MNKLEALTTLFNEARNPRYSKITEKRVERAMKTLGLHDEGLPDDELAKAIAIWNG